MSCPCTKALVLALQETFKDLVAMERDMRDSFGINIDGNAVFPEWNQGYAAGLNCALVAMESQLKKWKQG
jgi:hypothetical protein